MNTRAPTMTTLFLQLGLDAEPEAIADFMKTHQLSADVWLGDAPFWTPAQQQFLVEQLKADAAWAIIVDKLNEALHEDAVRAKLQAEAPPTSL